MVLPKGYGAWEPNAHVVEDGEESIQVGRVISHKMSKVVHKDMRSVSDCASDEVGDQQECGP